MKIELKHLAPYLPYGLHCSTEHGWTTMESLSDFCINGDHEESYSYEDHPDETLEFKPMLRPLSDLTKEIKHNEEKFVPIDLMFIDNKKTNGRAVPQFLEEKTRELSEGKIKFIHLPYWVIQKLFEWHFDVFGLIDKDLAIKKA